MPNFILAMTPDNLDQIDHLQHEYAALQAMMDDLTARYNDIARAVWADTLAGRTDFTEFHDPILRIYSELEVWHALRRELYQQSIEAALALPELTDLDDGCVFCLEDEEETEMDRLGEDMCDMGFKGNYTEAEVDMSYIVG
jgi:hypothetical protein